MESKLFVNPLLGLFHPSLPVKHGRLADPSKKRDQTAKIRIPPQGGITYDLCLDFLFGDSDVHPIKPVILCGRREGRLLGGMRRNLTRDAGTGASPEDSAYAEDMSYSGVDRPWKVHSRQFRDRNPVLWANLDGQGIERLAIGALAVHEAWCEVYITLRLDLSGNLAIVSSDCQYFADSSASSAIDKGVRLRWWLMMYTTFTEGLEEGLQLNVVYYMKEDLLMSPATSALIWGISRIPWLLKPILAFISDSIPIFGYRRKPYLIGSAGVHVISLCLLSLCHAPHSLILPLLCLSLRSTVRAWTAAISQAILVEDNQGEGREAINNIVADFFWVRAVGIVISSYGTGLLLEVFKPHTVFVLFSLFPATTCITTWFMHEDPFHVGVEGIERGQASSTAGEAPSLRSHLARQYREISEALGANSTLTASLVYFFFYMSGPNYDQALYYYYIDKLGFSPEIMGQVQMFKGTARLTGPLLYKFFLSSVPFSSLVKGLTIVSLPLYMLPALLTTGVSRQLGIPDAAFAISGEYVREAVLNIQVLPPIALATKLAPAGLEGTLFSLFTTVQSLSAGTSRLTSSAAIAMFGVNSPDFHGITALIFFCGMSLLAPLPVLSAMPEDEDQSANETYAVTEIIENQTGESTAIASTASSSHGFSSSDELLEMSSARPMSPTLGEGRRLTVSSVD
ncbi:hypothetical protein FOL47_009483 [Perkinsus chesapeaki]|uniref:Uncharacterized protein n=1 Tax=Perkinsus chesapeaki TaxID=330153 RepID=A0A7J6L811_PERCH|nr:hypothetical protein FOL47_009483 [Perkinsus chesapeaki]